MQCSREILDIVDSGGQVVGKITSKNLMIALAKKIDPNTPVKTLVEDLREITQTDNCQDIVLMDNGNLMGAALEASSDGILISDDKGNITYVNNAYEKITGLKKEQMIGRNLRILLQEKCLIWRHHW
jgi:PAS domain-containing protein